MGQNSSSVELTWAYQIPVADQYPILTHSPIRKRHPGSSPNNGERKTLRQCQVNPDLSTLEESSHLTLLHAMPG